MFNPIAQFKAWRERRYWAKRHLDFIRTRVLEDWRWMACDPIAEALTDRYKKITSVNWYRLDHEPIDVLRHRLGMDPVTEAKRNYD